MIKYQIASSYNYVGVNLKAYTNVKKGKSKTVQVGDFLELNKVPNELVENSQWRAGGC